MRTSCLKCLCAMLFVVIGITPNVYADDYDFESDGICYKILSAADRTAEVTKSYLDDDYEGDIVIPQRVFKGIPYAVVSIGNYAFSNCDELTSVSMPSVTTIGDGAFSGCSALTSIEMPEAMTIGESAFYGCSALTSVEMPAVATISESAFYACYSLTSVSMPSVTTIGDRAFYSCAYITSIDMSAATTIGEEAFCYCDGLTSVDMPAATTIGKSAFKECANLTSVNMPEVTTIGESAFRECSALASVSMPSVTTIGDDAFYDCDKLTSVNIPASCMSIGSNLFDGCFALKEIVVDENNPNYSSEDGVLYDKNKETLIYCPLAKTEVNIPSSATAIGDYAFYDCDKLTSVSMPAVMTIGNYAFYDCNKLTSVSMPAVMTIGDYAFCICDELTSVSMPAVTTIGKSAFNFCYSLTSVDIPASITIIGDYAFSVCWNLTSVYCHWEQPLECDPRFEETVLANATLYVPDGCVDDYRSVYPWSEFINIEEKDYSGIAYATASEVVIKVIDGAIVIEGGDGTVSMPTVEVYSAGGGCVYRGTDSSIGGLGHGIYVVKVGGAVQKVAL